MGLSDRLKDLRSKAESAVVERKDQIQETVQKVGEVADQRTGGKYHERIQKAGEKTTGFVAGLDRREKAGEADEVDGAADSPDGEGNPPESA